MKLTRLTFLYLLPLLCVLLPSAAKTEQSKPINAGKESPLSFILETKDTVVELFQPIAIRVILRNNSQSPILVDTKTLRLVPRDWHVVGSWGAWSGEGKGNALETENRLPGRIELPPGASVKLVTVHENPTFELLGPTRVGYTLSSTDPAIKKLLPTDTHQLSFHTTPSKLMSAVWAAQTQTDREQIQPAFNEFLKSSAAAHAARESEGGDFQEELADDAYATKALFYLAGYALPVLTAAARDKDPAVREQSVLAYSYAARAIDQFDAYLKALDELGPRPQWAALLNKNQNRNQADWRSFALRALTDAAPNVRRAAVTVLTKTDWDAYANDALVDGIGVPEQNQQEPSNQQQDLSRELNAVKELSSDPDARVRAAVQTYLMNFVDTNTGADAVVTALNDPDPNVRKKALDALLRSPKPPKLDTLKRAFELAKGDIALGLIPLLVEQEDSTLSTTLGKNFTNRSTAERLAIVTAIAGHADSATVDLIKLGLNDPMPVIQRAAVLRLLSLPADIATPLLQNYLQRANAELKPLATAAKNEIESRRLWPFLRSAGNDQNGASESVFPSQNGTTPVTSPDGQWIAYIETGWGRPGGSGGFGRSNLISITHVVDVDGKNDQVVSDMFLVGWIADSKRVGTARDGFVSISDFSGNAVAEFGEVTKEPVRYSSLTPPDWTKGELRQQFGAFMPHMKFMESMNHTFKRVEAGAFSPDGSWYGPLLDAEDNAFFLGADGRRLPFNQRISENFGGATWSPDGRFVLVHGYSEWLIIDVQTMRAHQIKNLDGSYVEGACGSERCRWDPWSKDGKQLTFLRDGQVWVSDVYGKNAKQLTFDSAKKAYPIFSRDGRSVAYRTWQPDYRHQNVVRLGPSDIWIVDITSTLATRVTVPAKAKVHNFDWLNDHTLIMDRHEYDDSEFFIVPRSSLRRISLN